MEGGKKNKNIAKKEVDTTPTGQGQKSGATSTLDVKCRRSLHDGSFLALFSLLSHCFCLNTIHRRGSQTVYAHNRITGADV